MFHFHFFLSEPWRRNILPDFDRLGLPRYRFLRVFIWFAFLLLLLRLFILILIVAIASYWYGTDFFFAVIFVDGLVGSWILPFTGQISCPTFRGLLTSKDLGKVFVSNGTPKHMGWWWWSIMVAVNYDWYRCPGGQKCQGCRCYWEETPYKQNLKCLLHMAICDSNMMDVFMWCLLYCYASSQANISTAFYLSALPGLPVRLRWEHLHHCISK